MVNLSLLLADAELTNVIGKLLYAMYEAIGNFGWTVVVFTLCLKVLVSPFDIWQKIATRKNNKAMKIMQPELDRLKSAYGDNPQVLNQKQRALYKEHGYSMMGACLPMLITMVIFFVVFSGFNACVRYENQRVIEQLADVYQEQIVDAGLLNGDLETEQQIMLDAYNKLGVNEKGQKKWKWLWVENVFMPDTWANPVPDQTTFTGSGLGNLNGDLPSGNLEFSVAHYDSMYNALLEPAMKEYNKVSNELFTKGFWQMGRWNGYLVLPVLSIVLSILSTRLTRGQQPEPPKQTDENGKPIPGAAGSMKMMTWIMPIMMGIFALFYSAAFTIYMFTNSLLTVLINVIFNLATKKKDAAEEQARLDAPYRRGL